MSDDSQLLFEALGVGARVSLSLRLSVFDRSLDHIRQRWANG
jgi:hypothetical protein